MLWTLVRKDIIRRYRSPVATVVMLLFPFMMAGMIGAVSGGGSGNSVPPMKLLVLDREDGLLGNLLTGGSPPSDSPMPLELVKVGEEGLRMMERGEASALLIIPENFTDQLLSGETVTLQLVRNPAESIKPEIIEQGLEVVATYLDVAVKALGPELNRLKDIFESDEMPQVMVITSFVGEFYEEMQKADKFVFPPVVTIGSDKQDDGKTPLNLFGYVLVMVSVMSVLFVSMRSVTDLYEDQRTGMLRRQLTTPMSITALVGAKIVFAMVFGVLVMMILLVAGAAFGWFQASIPVPWVLLHSMAFALATAGLMTVLISLVKTEKQAGILSWIVTMLMSVVGGSMFPAESLPVAVRGLSKFTLNYHAIEGFLDLIVRGEPVESALPRTALLAAVGIVLAVLGQFLMQRRLQEVLR